MRKGVLVLVFALFLPFLPDLPVPPALPVLEAAQVTFERTAADLKSPRAETRLRAAELLRDAAYPEAAVPLAAVITDPENDVQLAAIAAELNIFLSEPIKSRKRVGLIIEVRHRIDADAIFAAGPSALGPRLVPIEVLTALRHAARDESRDVALDALYAFGALSIQPGGASRSELLRSSGYDLVAILAVPDPGQRLAALLVMQRVFARRPLDEPVDPLVGDAVVAMLNDRNTTVRVEAMRALGAMRYERALQALTAAFPFYGKGELAESAIDALAHIGHASSSELLTAQLGARNALVKAIAIEGLARIGDPAKNAAIQSAVARERNDEVLLASHFAAALLANGSIDPILQALAGQKFHNLAFAHLVEVAPGRTALFTRASQDPDAALRADIAEILGLSGDATGLSIVEPMGRDRDPQVVRAAERAIARLRQR